MHIIIIGAGSAGQMLAKRLHEEKHTVALIDMDKDALAEAEAQSDIMVVHGGGARPKVLERAGVDRAEVLLAVSGSDEANLLACVFAGNAGVPISVARVTHSDYEGVDAEAFDIDLIVNEHEELAKELARMIQMPSALEVADLFSGEAVAVAVKFPSDCPLIMRPLKLAPEEAHLERVRFIAQKTIDGKVRIPSGDTEPMIGDTMYVVGKNEDVDKFLQYACPDEHRASRVVIAGGGATGVSLARLLEEKPLEVFVIEHKKERAELLSEMLACTVLHGDFLDGTILDEVQVNENTDFIATTVNDESNIMGCILAGRKGASFTVARVSRTQYNAIIEAESLLDRAMDPYIALFNSIYHFIQGRNVRSDYHFQQIDGELLEYDLEVGHKWAGQRVADLKMPKGSILAMLQRQDQFLPATGEVLLLPGDRLAIFALEKSVAKVRKVFS